MNATQHDLRNFPTVPGCAQDDQDLLAQSLKASMPQIRTVFTPTAEQALQHLQLCSPQGDPFPRLLLLSLSVPEDQTDWQLIQQIKTRYRQLPIVLISSGQHAELALKAYDHGVNSFVVKPSDQQEWKQNLALLADYWFTIVRLPKPQRN